MTYFDRRKFDGSALGVGYGSAEAFWTMMDSIVDGINNAAGAIHPPVSNETVLAALTDYADKMTILVEDEEGSYRFDAESAAAAAAHSVVVPNNITPPAAGRWIKFSALTTVHNNLSGLQGGQAGQYYHFTSADYTNRVTMDVAAVGAGLVLASGGANRTAAATAILSADLLTMGVAPAIPAAADEILVSAAANKTVKTGGVLYTNLVTALANIVAGNLAQGDGAKGLTDSGKATANLCTMAAIGVIGELLYTPLADKAAAASGIHKDNVVTMAAVAGAADRIITSAGLSKSVKDSGTALSSLASKVAGTDLRVAVIDGTGAAQAYKDGGKLLAALAERVAVPAVANLCGMDADGDPTDSGVVAANVVTQAAAASAAGYLPESAGASKVLVSSPLPTVWKQLGLAITKVGVPFCIEVDLNAAAAVIGVFNANAPFAFQVLDFHALCEAAVALGSAKLNDAFAGGGNDITDVVPMAVLDTLSRATKIVGARKNVALNGSLSVMKNGAADSGRGYIYAVRTA